MVRKPKPEKTVAGPQVPLWSPFPIMLGAVQFAPATEDVKIVDSKFGNSEVVLEGGTRIIVVPVIQGVKKVIGQIGPAGEPIYNVQIGWTFQTIEPEKAAESVRKSNKGRKSGG